LILLLIEHKIEYIVAPFEADSQIAIMDKLGMIDLVHHLEPLDDGQAARILGDLNAHVVFNRAAINHIDSFMRDDLLDKKNRLMMNF